MAGDAFKERQQTLENEFFHRVDSKLLEQLRKDAQDEKTRNAIAAVTGLSDENLLQELTDKGISAESVTALSLAPLAFVAWADRSVDQKEHDAIIKAAVQSGLQEGGIAAQMLESWLHTKPENSLFETWAHYAQGLMETLGSDAKSHLQAELMKRATDVAKASGGLVGLGKISSAEQSVLDKIENALR